MSEVTDSSSRFMMAIRVSSYVILMRAMAMDVFIARFASRSEISFGASFFASFLSAFATRRI